MLKIVNSVLMFAVELVMLWAFARFGFSKGSTVFMRYLWAFVCLAVIIALWAWLAAPKSEYRLAMPYLALFRSAMFFIASAFLYLLGQKNFAIGVFAVGILTQAIDYFLVKE